MTVTTGRMALRSACAVTTVRSGTPFERAKVMNSMRSTSIMLARVTRAISARLKNVSVRAGSARWWSRSSVAAQPVRSKRNERMPCAGKRSNFSAKISIIICPSQNAGTAKPMSEIRLTAWSTPPARRAAASTPSAMPMTTESTNCEPSSNSVAGSRDQMTALTLSRETNE